MPASTKGTDARQLAHFSEAAKDVEANTSDDALDRVFGKLDLSKKLDPEDNEADPKSDD